MRVRKRGARYGRSPRLCVHKSNGHIVAQIIDDETGNTLVSASTVEPSIRGELEHTCNKDGKVCGRCNLASVREKGLKTVVFDREGGYKYHGRVKELADAAKRGCWIRILGGQMTKEKINAKDLERDGKELEERVIRIKQSSRLLRVVETLDLPLFLPVGDGDGHVGVGTGRRFL